MTFPIKKRVTTELLIDGTAAALYIGDTQISESSNWGGQQVLIGRTTILSTEMLS